MIQRTENDFHKGGHYSHCTQVTVYIRYFSSLSLRLSVGLSACLCVCLSRD